MSRVTVTVPTGIPEPPAPPAKPAAKKAEKKEQVNE